MMSTIRAFYSGLNFQTTFTHCTVALYIILSLDVPLLKSDFFSRSEFLFGLSVGICRAVEESEDIHVNKN